MQRTAQPDGYLGFVTRPKSSAAKSLSSLAGSCMMCANQKTYDLMLSGTPTRAAVNKVS